MANPFKKMFKYFDTNDVDEVDESGDPIVKDTKPVAPPLPKREGTNRSSQKLPVIEKKQVQSHSRLTAQERTGQTMKQTQSFNRPTAPTSRPQRPIFSNSYSTGTTIQEQQSTPVWGTQPVQPSTPTRPKAPSQPPRYQAEVQDAQVKESDKGDIRITIRYPQRYEDATAIVDLLIQNETLLIDFEYMDEAQARRCIDFLDGASRVLFGSLQRVGGTLYLLAPKNVVVTAEEIRLAKPGQDQSYDYDMKRR